MIELVDENAAAAWMCAHRPPQPGRRWSACRYGPTGWYLLSETDAHGRGPRGPLTVLGPGPGPGPLVLTLSANPLIHSPEDTRAVLTELGSAGWSAPALAEEIARRTALRRLVD